jgi:cell division protein FtsB
MDVEKVPNTLAAGIKATGGEERGSPGDPGGARDGTLSGPPAAASMPPASGEHEGGEVREGSGILPSLGWQGAAPPPSTEGGAGGTTTPDQDIQSYRARLESEGHRLVAAKHYRSVLNRVANSVGAVPIALGEMGVEHIAEGAESLSRYRDQLEEINSALTIDRTGMAAWAASHEHHEEHHQREKELEAEIERLEAERDTLRAERDALLNLIVQPWARDGDGAQLWKVNLAWWETATSREEGVAMVRRAAGLEAKS